MKINITAYKLGHYKDSRVFSLKKLIESQGGKLKEPLTKAEKDIARHFYHNQIPLPKFNTDWHDEMANGAFDMIGIEDAIRWLKTEEGYKRESTKGYNIACVVTFVKEENDNLYSSSSLYDEIYYFYARSGTGEELGKKVNDVFTQHLGLPYRDQIDVVKLLTVTKDETKGSKNPFVPDEPPKVTTNETTK